MKKLFTPLSLSLLTLFIILTSCSSDSEPQPANEPSTPSQVVTLPAQVNGPNVVLSVQLISAGTNLSGVGLCYSQQPNPTFINESVGNNITEPGTYTFNVNNLQPNTTYYARAFANHGHLGIQYGNEITFTVGTNINTHNVTNIVSTKATLNGFVIPDASNMSYAGFAYSTSPNPTTNDDYESTVVVGADNYSIEITGLTPGTTYYVRAHKNGVYGEQVQFKTAGYTGPAGGIVAYDKGEVTDGWRYMEVHPVSLQYTTAGIGANWGAIETFVSGLSPQVGAGPANTSIIVNAATEANCAAKMCQNLTLNGYSDWFLGSRDEMILIANSVLATGLSLDYMWTSNQTDATYAIQVSHDFFNDPYTAFIHQPKNHNMYVYPVRRY
jgi:hypothetical protein